MTPSMYHVTVHCGTPGRMVACAVERPRVMRHRMVGPPGSRGIVPDGPPRVSVPEAAQSRGEERAEIRFGACARQIESGFGQAVDQRADDVSAADGDAAAGADVGAQ